MPQYTGILMIRSWPLLVVAAIFFTAWMKPALPNGEWFQVYCRAKAHLYTPVFHFFFQFHRTFMLAALILTAVGFILVFVASTQNLLLASSTFVQRCGDSYILYTLLSLSSVISMSCIYRGPALCILSLVLLCLLFM